MRSDTVRAETVGAELVGAELVGAELVGADIVGLLRRRRRLKKLASAEAAIDCNAVYVTTEADETVSICYMQEYFSEIVIEGESVEIGSGELTYTFSEAGGHDVRIVLADGATTLYYAFYNCTALYSLDASSWDVSSVTTMQSMFHSCSSLTTLDASAWDTSSVTTMQSMLLQCLNLTAITGSLDVSAATDIGGLTRYDTNLYTLSLTNLGAQETVATEYAFNSTIWGTGEDDTSRQSLIDTLITNSFDRATAGYDALAITLSSASYAVLTEDEIAEATAKGFTIAV